MIPQMQAAGEPLPDWYLDRPRQGAMDDFYRAAYWNLDTERAFNGWSVPPIPESKIYEYGRRQGLTHRNAQAFVYVIRQMDRAHVKWQRDEIEAAKPPKP